MPLHWHQIYDALLQMLMSPDTTLTLMLIWRGGGPFISRKWWCRAWPLRLGLRLEVSSK